MKEDSKLYHILTLSNRPLALSRMQFLSHTTSPRSQKHKYSAFLTSERMMFKGRNQVKSRFRRLFYTERCIANVMNVA